MKEYSVIPKIRKETRRVKIVFELKKDLQEYEVICEHCHGTGLEIADNVYGIKGDTTYIGVRFPYKHQALSFCKHCYNGVQRKCSGCGAIKKRDAMSCPCGYDRKQLALQLAARNDDCWEKATKIALDEAFEKYEMLYIDQLDEYVSGRGSLELLLEEYCFDDNDKKFPAIWRIYGTAKTKITLNAEDIIERACEDLHEDAMAQCDVESLQKILDEWADQQSGTETYFPDFSVGVILDSSYILKKDGIVE